MSDNELLNNGEPFLGSNGDCYNNYEPVLTEEKLFRIGVSSAFRYLQFQT